MERQKITHTLAPVYDADSRLLLLGTMPSPKSRESGFYYGHPQNRFWKVLALLFEVPTPGSIPEKLHFLKEHRIALWDVLDSCEIAGASDASIRSPLPNDISRILRETEIRTIFTTGAKATALYKKYCFPQTGMEAIGLPSTSPANAKIRLEELAEAYSPIRLATRAQERLR